MPKTHRVIIVGGGPGGVAAARHLRSRASGQLEIILLEQAQASEFLPGTIATALGQTLPVAWQQSVSLSGITVRTETVTAVSSSGVTLASGEDIKADAVIAAPGLALDLDSMPTLAQAHAFWSPTTAKTASEAVLKLQMGTVMVVVASLPYRCPPAPYSLAMQLASYYQTDNCDIKIILTTPEEAPLATIGGEVPTFLHQSCAEMGITIHTEVKPDWAQSAHTHLVYDDGTKIDYDLALIIPPHTRSPLLRHLPGDGPLVPVSKRFESEEAGLFVIGDAAMTPLRERLTLPPHRGELPLMPC